MDNLCEKEWIDEEKKYYCIYFYRRDYKNMWNCIVHIHLGKGNDSTYHSISKKKEKAKKIAKEHVLLKTRYLKNSILSYRKRKKNVIKKSQRKMSNIHLPPPVIQNNIDYGSQSLFYNQI